MPSDLCTRNPPHDMKAASRLFANMYTAKEGCENMALEVTMGLAGGLSGLPNGGANLLFLSGLTVRRTKLKLVGRASCNEISVGIFRMLKYHTVVVHGQPGKFTVYRPTDLAAHSWI